MLRLRIRTCSFSSRTTGLDRSGRTSLQANVGWRPKDVRSNHAGSEKLRSNQSSEGKFVTAVASGCACLAMHVRNARLFSVVENVCLMGKITWQLQGLYAGGVRDLACSERLGHSFFQVQRLSCAAVFSRSIDVLRIHIARDTQTYMAVSQNVGYGTMAREHFVPYPRFHTYGTSAGCSFHTLVPYPYSIYLFLGLAPTGQLRRVGSSAGVVSFGQGCMLGNLIALRQRGCHFGPILGHRGSYAGLCWTCCSCHDIAPRTACSCACANFWLGNFMLCWRYLGSNIARSVGPS